VIQLKKRQFGTSSVLASDPIPVDTVGGIGTDSQRMVGAAGTGAHQVSIFVYEAFNYNNALSGTQIQVWLEQKMIYLFTDTDPNRPKFVYELDFS